MLHNLWILIKGKLTLKVILLEDYFIFPTMSFCMYYSFQPYIGLFQKLSVLPPFLLRITFSRSQTPWNSTQFFLAPPRIPPHFCLDQIYFLRPPPGIMLSSTGGLRTISGKPHYQIALCYCRKGTAY